MHRAFEFDARQLLAADLLIAADQPLDKAFLDRAVAQNITSAQTVVFPTMASAGNFSKLTSLKAVSASYPLRGSLGVGQILEGRLQESSVNQGPQVGSVWVEEALLNNLHTSIGSQLRLGSHPFLIAGVLTRELDRGAGFMNFAPRVMMNLADLPSTGLIGLGSRVTYRLLLAGTDTQIASYQQWALSFIESQGLRGIRIESLDNAQPTMRKTLERAEQFLSLIALLTAMIASVAIALSARRYMYKQADACAALKCFGATRSVILNRQIKTLTSLGLIAALVGSLFGFGVQELLTSLLGNLVPGNLPGISPQPALWSVLFTWFLLLGFAGPQILGLVNVSPIRLIRKEFAPATLATIWVSLIAFLCCISLILLAAQDWKLGLWVGISFAGAVLVFSALARCVLWGLSKIQTQNFSINFVLNVMGRRAGFAVMQITALGIALMALLIILLLRQDLLATWQGNIPANAPNRFMINIQDDQKQGVTELLKANDIATPDLYPMVRGRLVEINGRDIAPADYPDENAKRLVDREFNLSYTDQLPVGNRITSGKWISGDSPQISMEVGIAKTLKLKLGDQLSFEVAGEKVTAPITSLRKLDWGSMRVNFFVIMPPAQLSSLPQSWITSYYQNPTLDATKNMDFKLSQAYPNLTLVDVSVSLHQIQEVLNKLSAALGLLFAFTILAALLVLIAAIAATQDERYRNAALLKAIGASKEVLGLIAKYELLLIGLTAGILAGAASGVAAWALGRFVMEIEFNAFTQSLMMGCALGVVASLAAGYRFQRRIQNATAIECLREA